MMFASQPARPRTRAAFHCRARSLRLDPFSTASIGPAADPAIAIGPSAGKPARRAINPLGASATVTEPRTVPPPIEAWTM